jgi:hypothetical protein
MTVTGMYRITLMPGVDEQAFVTHMTTVAFHSSATIQPTRITRAFEHRLLKPQGDFRQFIWLVTAELVTDHGYDFEGNREGVQGSIAAFGVLTGIDSCLDVARS